MNEKTTSEPICQKLRCFAFIGVLGLLSGCAVGPNYQRPTVNTPANFRFGATNTENSIAEWEWRAVFSDQQLRELIETALTNNYDLQRAAARVEQARYSATAARSAFFPQINYSGDIGRGDHAVFNAPADHEDAISSAAVMLNATWEVDFWGRVRRLNESARAQFLASDMARRAVMVSLVSDIAASYYQLLDLDQELAIQRAATNAYADTHRIFDERRINGIASKLETDRAMAAMADAAAVIPQLEIQIAATENRINILLGRNPGPVARGSLTTQPQPQLSIPAGLPSDLLRRRPDILASEQSLVTANADIGVAVANFFPRIGLTTFLGHVSPELDAFTAGAGNAWNAGGSLVGPLFQGGRLRAEYKGAQARFDEAKLAYQQNVLIAFGEVSDALISREKLAEASFWSAQAVAALSSAVNLATDRYLNGRSSYFEVLQAQQELYPAQRSEVQTRSGEWIAFVQLYRALGGGWQPEEQSATDKNHSAGPSGNP